MTTWIDVCVGQPRPPSPRSHGDPGWSDPPGTGNQHLLISTVKADTSKTSRHNERHPTSRGLNERKCEGACASTRPAAVFDALCCLKEGKARRVNTVCDADGGSRSRAFVLNLTASHTSARKKKKEKTQGSFKPSPAPTGNTEHQLPVE